MKQQSDIFWRYHPVTLKKYVSRAGQETIEVYKSHLPSTYAYHGVPRSQKGIYEWSLYKVEIAI